MSNNNYGLREFDIISAVCLDYFKAKSGADVAEMAVSIMNMSDFPMHNFAHHYLVPAVMLTALYIKNGESEEKHTKDMATICERAKNVPPGSCGFYGACGAAVGVGIFFCVMTNATPVKKETWSLCNRSTADALRAMAEAGGPRCCKRNTFIALRSGTSILREEFSEELLPHPEKIKCTFDKFNLECLKSDCPFYQEQLA